MSELSFSVAQDAAATTATVGGEIDMHNADAFGRELQAATDMASERLIVDLSNVSYLDSAGLGHLFGVAARLADRRVALAVVLPEGSSLRRLLAIVQFDQVAAIVGDLAAARTCASRDAP